MAVERIRPKCGLSLDSIVWDEQPETLAALQEMTRRADGSPGFLPPWGVAPEASALPSALLWVEHMKCWLPLARGDRVVKDPFQLGCFALAPDQFQRAYEFTEEEAGQYDAQGSHPCRFRVLLLNEQRGLAGIRCECHDRAYVTVSIGEAHQCSVTGAWSPPEIYDEARRGDNG